MRFRFIKDHQEEFPTRLMCRVPGVSTSGYYAWRGRPVAPDLLDQAFQVAEPNRVWLADITYLPTGEGWLYLAVPDLATRKSPSSRRRGSWAGRGATICAPNSPLRPWSWPFSVSGHPRASSSIPSPKGQRS